MRFFLVHAMHSLYVYKEKEEKKIWEKIGTKVNLSASSRRFAQTNTVAEKKNQSVARRAIA